LLTNPSLPVQFGRNLLEMLGDDAPPIGLIQSAVRLQRSLLRSTVQREP
jgi:hypothetical protein